MIGNTRNFKNEKTQSYSEKSSSIICGLVLIMVFDFGPFKG